jgi:alkylation response protein AidB-like acyl-CoA dehydrogenase
VNTILSSNQRALKEKYRRFADEHLAPVAKELENHTVGLKEFAPKLAQAGYLGITVPDEYGGQGGNFLNFILFAEAVAEKEPGLVLTLASHVAVIEVLKRYGSDSQKSRYLPLLAQGTCLATLAFSEPGAGEDYAAVVTRLSNDQKGLALTGTKSWVVNAQLSDLYLVLAKTATVNDDTTADQLTIVLVDAVKANSLKVSPSKERLGLRSAQTAALEFISHPLLPEAVLPVEASAGQEQILFAMDIAKVTIAAASTGLMEGALALARDHALNDHQFGEPIAHQQSVQWKLADLACALEAARLMTYRAAWSKDECPTDLRKNAAMCKYLASYGASRHSAEAMQILATAGLDIGSPMERFYRDAKVMEIVEGTSEFQKILLAKELGV